MSAVHTVAQGTSRNIRSSVEQLPTHSCTGVQSRQNGGRLGTAKFGDLINSGIAVAQSLDSDVLLDLMQGFYDRDGTYCFRREMFYAMPKADIWRYS